MQSNPTKRCYETHPSFPKSIYSAVWQFHATSSPLKYIWDNILNMNFKFCTQRSFLKQSTIQETKEKKKDFVGIVPSLLFYNTVLLFSIHVHIYDVCIVHLLHLASSKNIYIIIINLRPTRVETPMTPRLFRIISVRIARFREQSSKASPSDRGLVSELLRRGNVDLGPRK